MRILVTGGAGFIGSHLCDRLLARGHDVVAVDNLLTGSRRNIGHLAGESRFTFVEQDLRFGVPSGPFDAIFHLASPASPVGYGRYPIETMQVNSLGTQRALELARDYGAKFLLASTSEVYGDPDVHPQPEHYWGNVNSVGPRCCYDEGKRYAEALTVTFRQVYNLDARIIRIFNTYGPRNDPNDGRIIPNFVAQAIRNEPITVFGDGLQTRSYCFVADLINGIERAMFVDGTNGLVINLGNPDEHSAADIAERIRALAGSASVIEHRSARAEEIARRQPDITRARTLLEWQPVVSLDEGLTQTIAWFRQVLVSA